VGCFMSSYNNDALMPIIYECLSSLTFKSASRAGTMAFYGKLTTDLSIQMEASRWYEKALQIQIKRTNRDPEMIRRAPPNVEDILRPLMLTLFESSVCTSSLGWLHHVGAGARLIERLGPVACQTNPSHSIFLSIRLNSVSFSYLPVVSSCPLISRRKCSYTELQLYPSPLSLHRKLGARSHS
jgi:hypothetical protein